MRTTVIFLAACIAAEAARPTCDTCDGPGSCASCPSGLNLCDWDCADYGSSGYANCAANLKTYDKCDYTDVKGLAGAEDDGPTVIGRIRANPALAWTYNCICNSECGKYAEYQTWSTRTSESVCTVAASVTNTFRGCLQTQTNDCAIGEKIPNAWTATSEEAVQSINANLDVAKVQ